MTGPTDGRTGFGKIRPHTIIALVEDKPGVLNRIASKWRQRGFNIESLAVGHSEKPGLSRMTFVVDADTNAEQVVRQLDEKQLVAVIRQIDLPVGAQMVLPVKCHGYLFLPHQTPSFPRILSKNFHASGLLAANRPPCAATT